MPSLFVFMAVQAIVPPVGYAPPAPPADRGARPPVYRNRVEVIRSKDYPKAALRAGKQGVVGYRVRISAKGKPTDCAIVESSGDMDLDARSCEKIMQRARFHPATDANGRRVAGELDARVLWRMPN